MQVNLKNSAVSEVGAKTLMQRDVFELAPNHPIRTNLIEGKIKSSLLFMRQIYLANVQNLLT